MQAATFIPSTSFSLHFTPRRRKFPGYHYSILRQVSTCSADAVDLTPRPSTSSPKFSFLTYDLILFPPSPVILSRRTLEQDFAVCLLRNGYNAVDKLDFIAMDEFQARFWELRAQAWEKYLKKNPGIIQGVITDPRYFDFISYAQMIAIQDALRAPRVVFEERVGKEEGGWESRVVRRDMGKYPDAESLLIGWRDLVGIGVYEWMIGRIRRPMKVDIGNRWMNEVKNGIEEIYDYFVRCGFCIEVRMNDDNGKMRVEIVGPANLWSNRMLRRVKGIGNDYDCWCVKAFVERSGGWVNWKTERSENCIVRDWELGLDERLQ